MTYQQQPVAPTNWMPTPPTAQPPAKNRAVPILVAVVVILAAAVVVLSIALTRTHGNATTPAPTAAASAVGFAQIKTDCGVVAGYQVEDAGRTLVMTVGGAYMNTDTAACIFNKLGVPDAVRQHVSTTRALDGQQTDSWPGYTARWTYHPDDGLQMTIQAD